MMWANCDINVAEWANIPNFSALDEFSGSSQTSRVILCVAQSRKQALMQVVRSRKQALILNLLMIKFAYFKRASSYWVP